MTTPSQRQVFLGGEGDAWFQRNERANTDQINDWSSDDPLIPLLESLPLPHGPEISVLEVGCGQGLLLTRLHSTRGWFTTGIDPSQKAIAAIKAAGHNGVVGTADSLTIPDQSVDILIYGFCLYLCDRDDLFRIASEAHRVLKPQSWLTILDFWSPSLTVNAYHHHSGITSHKDNLPDMFTWHPSYVLTDHRLRHHANPAYTDNPQEWVSATVLRRCDFDFRQE